MADNKPTEAPIDDLSTWVQACREAKAHAKRWTEIADRAEEQITAKLEQAGAGIGTINGRPVVRWTEVATSQFNTRKFRAEYPELDAQFRIPSTSHRFTLVEDKGGK